MAELITVPSFTFNQGGLGDDDFEHSIQVSFYNGTICIQQKGSYEEMDSINLSPNHFEKLFKEIKKHLPKATEWLEKH